MSGFKVHAPEFHLGLQALWKAQIVALTKLLGMFRTTGARLVLLPLAGAANLAAFATIRTGANIAQQGLSTITGPLMPELMRVLKDRDQSRSEAGFATVWIILVLILAPAVVLLHAVVEPLFSIWTRGQIAFESTLFGVLSISVLVFAWSQPAMAVVAGNNLLRPQLLVALATAAIGVGGILILVPLIGILGAGVALLAAELVAAVWVRRVAEHWLIANGMVWPRGSARVAGLAVWIAALAVTALVVLPEATIYLLIAAFILFWNNALRYWRSLPDLARGRIGSIAARFCLYNPWGKSA